MFDQKQAEECAVVLAALAEQNRIRENMKTVAAQTPYYERLMAKLGEQETSIETLQRERAGLSTRRDTLRRDLEDYLGGLRVG